MANLQPFHDRNLLGGNWDPWGDFMRLANVLRDRSGLSTFTMAYPAIDVRDTSNAYLVKADLPGYSKENVEIELEGNTITIKGNVISEEQTESKDLIHQERCRREFRRTLTLPANIDSENVKASFNNGVLEINLPKVKSKGRQVIIH